MVHTNNTPLDEAYIALGKDTRVYDKSLSKSASFIARQCAEALSINRASVWLLSEDQSRLECLTLYSTSYGNNADSYATIEVVSVPDYYNALLTHRVIDAHDVYSDRRTFELAETYLKPLNVRSLLNAPLRHLGKLQGVLSVELAGEQRQWSQDEQFFVASVSDLLSQRLIVAELAKSEANYKALYDHTSEGILVFGQSVFVDANRAMCDIFRGTRDQIIGRNPVDFSPEFQRDGQPSGPMAMKYLQDCLAGKPQNFEWIHLRLDGSEFHADITLNAVQLAGEDTLFALVRDITAKKEAEEKALIAQAEIEYQASHDSLTGLLNRDQLHKHVNNLISEPVTQHPSLKIALLLFDLNRFKEVNDTLGHATGDQVLVKIADLLLPWVEQHNGGLFRLGGDEFVAVFDNQQCIEPFENLEQMLNQRMKTTLCLDDISIEMSASIGIAVYPENGNTSQELLRCADVAMYHAKTNDGVSSWYDTKNDLNNKRRLAMMVELGSAIRDNKLVLHFQPRINIATGEITGCEALTRWNHESLGMVPPGDFLPLAEMSELIHPLSAWVLRESIQQIKRLLANGHNVPVAMNVSARNLTDSLLIDTLEEAIRVEKIDPVYLEIEITESALINHPVRALQNLERLDKLGVSIAIDDFGTGYSSLTYLKKMPLDTLKIDRSFVSEMLTSESDSVIVDSTIDLAHNFSFTVVAEGVEDQETLDALAAKNCDQAQGFFIAKPMPADEFEQWLAEYDDSQFRFALAS